MLMKLDEILALAERGGFAVPAFNVYNMETVMGVAHAAEKLRSPVIFQIYSRLFDKENGRYTAANVLAVAKDMTVPVALHLDHGAKISQVDGALKAGCTGVMIDASTKSFDENVAITKEVVAMAKKYGVTVEGELGHIGTTHDETVSAFTEVADAAEYVKQTGVSALAIMVGTAHGRYKKAPKLAIDRIRDIKAETGIPLVLHGGSGVPDEEMQMAIKAGIRKINFSTDLCYSFLDTVFATSRDLIGIDLFMNDAIDAVEAFAASKIKVLGAENRA